MPPISSYAPVQHATRLGMTRSTLAQGRLPDRATVGGVMSQEIIGEAASARFKNLNGVQMVKH